MLHQACVEKYNAAKGSKCLWCRKPVHLGLEVEGVGQLHKGFLPCEGVPLLRTFCLSFGHLEEPVAPLAADAALARLCFKRGNTHGRAVIVLSNADALEVFAVENIMLVVCPTAFLGFAKRTQVFCAGPSVCFWVDDCEVRRAR